MEPGCISRVPCIFLMAGAWPHCLDTLISPAQADISPNIQQGFPGGSDARESTCKAVDLGSIPSLERSLGEGNGNLLQYSCLENPMDRGAWWATVHGVAELDTTEHSVLSDCQQVNCGCGCSAGR